MDILDTPHDWYQFIFFFTAVWVFTLIIRLLMLYVSQDTELYFRKHLINFRGWGVPVIFFQLYIIYIYWNKVYDYDWIIGSFLSSITTLIYFKKKFKSIDEDLKEIDEWDEQTKKNFKFYNKFDLHKIKHRFTENELNSPYFHFNRLRRKKTTLYLIYDSCIYLSWIMFTMMLIKILWMIQDM